MKTIFKVYNTATGEYQHLGLFRRDVWEHRYDAERQAERANWDTRDSEVPADMEVHEFELVRVAYDDWTCE